MAAAATATVLSPYPIDPVVTRGGAQRVMADLCDWLESLGWTCVLLESDAWRESVAPGRSLRDGLGGRPTTARRWRAAGPDRAAVVAAGDVAAVVAAAQLVLVVDRAVGTFHTVGCRVLVLSNIAYDNERQAAADPGWDMVWVPSPYLADQIVADNGRVPDHVHVVPPALTETRCEPARHEPLRALVGRLEAAGRPRDRRLLFPHRADPGKGLTTAVDVLRRLIDEDERWTLIATGATDQDDPAAAAVVEQARGMVARAGVASHVEWVPWLPRPEMTCLYRLAGCTLMPSTLPEGFALVPVESLACGVPVAATPTGNLPHLAARFPAIHLFEDLAGAQAVAAITTIAGTAVPDAERQAVRAAFDVGTQRDAVAAALRVRADTP